MSKYRISGVTLGQAAPTETAHSRGTVLLVCQESALFVGGKQPALRTHQFPRAPGIRVLACSAASAMADSTTSWTVARRILCPQGSEARMLGRIALSSHRGSSGTGDQAPTCLRFLLHRQTVYPLSYLGSPMHPVGEGHLGCSQYWQLQIKLNISIPDFV